MQLIKEAIILIYICLYIQCCECCISNRRDKMLDSLNTSILLDRIELICKMGGSEYLNDNDRQMAFFWLGELIKQVKSELET